jgi:prophage regulatory protein
MAQSYRRVNEISSRPGKPGRYPISAATWWRWVKERKAPQPVKLGPNTTVWSEEQLDAWDAQIADGSPGNQPASA